MNQRQQRGWLGRAFLSAAVFVIIVAIGCTIPEVRKADKLAARPVWMCIGNSDDRVGTDALIKLARGLTAEANRQQKLSDVDLHVVNSRGHTIHPTAHDEAAAWVTKQFPY